MTCSGALSSFVLPLLVIFAQLQSWVQSETTSSSDSTSTNWSVWSGWSPCSTLCGPGLQQRTRQCLHRGKCPAENEIQTGLCEVKICPKTQPTFREKACTKYNQRSFSGKTYSWEPFVHSSSPCKLSCRAKGVHFYANLPSKVQDGEPCHKKGHAKAVCLGGLCKPVGCDGIILSPARVDKCGVCLGDGTECQTVAGIFTTSSLAKGINHVITIPEGSTSINITELSPSDNQLILQSASGRILSKSGTIKAAGTTFHFTRKTSTNPRESILSDGPTTDILHVKLLTKSRNLGIQYTFSVPDDGNPTFIQDINGRIFHRQPIESAQFSVKDKTQTRDIDEQSLLAKNEEKNGNDESDTTTIHHPLTNNRKRFGLDAETTPSSPFDGSQQQKTKDIDEDKPLNDAQIEDDSVLDSRGEEEPVFTDRYKMKYKKMPDKSDDDDDDDDEDDDDDDDDEDGDDDDDGDGNVGDDDDGDDDDDEEDGFGDEHDDDNNGESSSSLESDEVTSKNYESISASSSEDSEDKSSSASNSEESEDKSSSANSSEYSEDKSRDASSSEDSEDKIRDASSSEESKDNDANRDDVMSSDGAANEEESGSIEINSSGDQEEEARSFVHGLSLKSKHPIDGNGEVKTEDEDNEDVDDVMQGRDYNTPNSDVGNDSSEGLQKEEPDSMESREKEDGSSITVTYFDKGNTLHRTDGTRIAGKDVNSVTKDNNVLVSFRPKTAHKKFSKPFFPINRSLSTKSSKAFFVPKFSNSFTFGSKYKKNSLSKRTRLSNSVEVNSAGEESKTYGTTPTGHTASRNNKANKIDEHRNGHINTQDVVYPYTNPRYGATRDHLISDIQEQRRNEKTRTSNKRLSLIHLRNEKMRQRMEDYRRRLQKHRDMVLQRWKHQGIGRPKLTDKRNRGSGVTSNTNTREGISVSTGEDRRSNRYGNNPAPVVVADVRPLSERERRREDVVRIDPRRDQRGRTDLNAADASSQQRVRQPSIIRPSTGGDNSKTFLHATSNTRRPHSSRSENYRKPIIQQSVDEPEYIPNIRGTYVSALSSGDSPAAEDRSFVPLDTERKISNEGRGRRPETSRQSSISLSNRDKTGIRSGNSRSHKAHHDKSFVSKTDKDDLNRDQVTSRQRPTHAENRDRSSRLNRNRYPTKTPVLRPNRIDESRSPVVIANRNDVDQTSRIISNRGRPGQLSSVLTERRGKAPPKILTTDDSAKRYSSYTWKVSGLSECTHSCGGGVQQTMVVCVDTTTQAVVTDENCYSLRKPQGKAFTCNLRPCPAQWVPGPWSSCSVSCGDGEQTRTLTCQARVSPTFNLTMPHSSCLKWDSPVTRRNCNPQPCSTWTVGNWSECSSNCGDGVRRRDVTCVSNRGERLDGSNCLYTKPDAEERCNLGACGKGWFFTEWPKECPVSCGKGFVSRKVFCSSEEGQIIPDDRCDQTNRPQTHKQCHVDIPCGGTWYTGPWAQCNSSCGNGTRTRDVMCIKTLPGEVFAVVGEENCVSTKKPKQEEDCLNPECQPEWYTASWGECSRSCGSGYKTREIRCVSPTHRNTNTCPLESRPKSRELCNTLACSQDTTTKPKTDDTGQCKDTFSRCRIVKRARLCGYAFYKNKCCKSCS